MKEFSHSLYQELIVSAESSPRKRSHFLLHKDHSDVVQRMFVVVEPESYIRPHRHINPNKWEQFVVIRGKAAMLCFDDAGKVLELLEISSIGPAFSIDVPATGVFHTLVSLEPHTLLIEIKPGPFTPLSPNDSAEWSPAEYTNSCARFVSWLKTAKAGDKPPANLYK